MLGFEDRVGAVRHEALSCPQQWEMQFYREFKTRPLLYDLAN